MATRGSLKKLQQRFLSTLPQRKTCYRPATLEQIEVPCNSLFSEYSSYCCEWSDTSSIESAELSRADYTLESEEVHYSHHNHLLDFSVQMSEDNYSSDSDPGDLDLSLLSSIRGATCSPELIASPLNSTRRDYFIHSGLADITCSDFTTDFTNEEPDLSAEAPPRPFPTREPLGPRPPCEGREALQVNHELVAADVVAMTMSRSRKRHIRKSLKRLESMIRDGHQGRLRTLAVL